MKTISLLALVCLAFTGLHAQNFSDGQKSAEALSKEDELFLKGVLSPYATLFKANLHFEVHRPGGETTTATFVLYENKGEAIALFRSPPRDKGKAILQIKGKYWIYFPKTKRSSVLSPLSSMVGNASNGDVLRPPLSTFYDVTILEDKDGKGDRIVQYVASKRDSPYGKIIAHYDGEKIIESELYARSGIMLKKIYYNDYIKNESGFGYFPLQSKIVDGSNEEQYTVLTFSEVEILEEINESWFSPQNLARVR